jgi:hypothetical protein
LIRVRSEAGQEPVEVGAVGRRGVLGTCPGVVLRGVLGGSGGVGAVGRGAPDQDARFGLFQPPPVGLLAPVMAPAQRTVAAFDQATDRAYRIGQDRPVQVHRLIAEGTLEDKIAALLESKRELAEAVVGSGERWISELSDGELSELVSLRAVS